ncbi:MAG: hypothetical protein CMJ80_17780 [Planctomycetaceae bacterium]|nr:hypothetical protein [Planctomycetaceae bacterium]
MEGESIWFDDSSCFNAFVLRRARQLEASATDLRVNHSRFERSVTTEKRESGLGISMAFEKSV